MKLTCKVCGHESGNLVPHIENDHPEIPLKSYMDDHGGIEAVIHSSLLAKTKEAKVVKFKKAGVGKVKVAGAEVEKCSCPDELAQHIPETSDAYQFQDFTKDVIYDLNGDVSRPVLLVGHTGCGKTSCFQELAGRLGAPTIRANLNHQTTISDFVGMWGVKGGETYWIDGVLPWAMRNGVWLILDELDFADPAILSVLNSILEPGQPLVLKEKGNEVIKPHKDFRICATANAVGQYAEYRGLYQGTNIMNEAFLDRWRVYIVDYLPEDLERKVLEKSIPLMSAGVAEAMVKVASAVRKAFNEETVQCTFSTRRLLDWGELTIRHRNLKVDAPFKAAESVIFSKISREDALAIRSFMQRILMDRG